MIKSESEILKERLDDEFSSLINTSQSRHLNVIKNALELALEKVNEYIREDAIQKVKEIIYGLSEEEKIIAKNLLDDMIFSVKLVGIED